MTREEILAVAKPILFNTEMVCKVLDGTKSATRRVVKPQPFAVKQDKTAPCWCGHFVSESGKVLPDKPPYCPGDILYVRETWTPWSRTEGTVPGIHYKADGETLPGVKWRPSIHMPKEAARIFLRVTDVRVERLQDIDNAGALAEGCDGRGESPQDGGLSDWQKNYDFSVERFSVVWNSTIKPADRALYGWGANPWVWCYEFERVEAGK